MIPFATVWTLRTECLNPLDAGRVIPVQIGGSGSGGYCSDTINDEIWIDDVEVTTDNAGALLVHDAHDTDPSTAFALSRLTDAGVLHQSPIGIFRDVDRPTYDDQARSQIATASEAIGDREQALAGLISGSDTWTIV